VSIDQDWLAWHERYDEPGSRLARRLVVVQDRITRALAAAPPGQINALSMCAGQGRDLLGVLEHHPRRDDVTGVLVELDPRNAETARQRVRDLGLRGVEVVTGDAAQTDHYLAYTPADLVLACGIFGNLSDEDVRRTIGYCATLCAPGGSTVWTRHRNEPDLVPKICDWFEEYGFELEFVTEPGDFGVGAHRRRADAEPRALPPGETMFTFIGYLSMAQRGCE
jgi:ubiquinone/menaquinone biosynthesis C-methylase UbiE